MGPIVRHIIPVLHLMPNLRTSLILFSHLLLGSLRCPISFRYSNHNFVRIPCLMRATYHAYLTLDHLNNIRSSVQVMKLYKYDIFSSSCSSYVHPDTPVSTVSVLFITLTACLQILHVVLYIRFTISLVSNIKIPSSSPSKRPCRR